MQILKILKPFLLAPEWILNPDRIQETCNTAHTFTPFPYGEPSIYKS